MHKYFVYETFATSEIKVHQMDGVNIPSSKKLHFRSMPRNHKKISEGALENQCHGGKSANGLEFYYSSETECIVER